MYFQSTTEFMDNLTINMDLQIFSMASLLSKSASMTSSSPTMFWLVLTTSGAFVTIISPYGNEKLIAITKLNDMEDLQNSLSYLRADHGRFLRVQLLF